jgi:hypothetical protein
MRKRHSMKGENSTGSRVLPMRQYLLSWASKLSSCLWMKGCKTNWVIDFNVAKNRNRKQREEKLFLSERGSEAIDSNQLIQKYYESQLNSIGFADIMIWIISKNDSIVINNTFQCVSLSLIH